MIITKTTSSDFAPWFAWYPVRLDQPKGSRKREWAWLETVDRQIWGYAHYQRCYIRRPR
jgi:hypothetical protein